MFEILRQSWEPGRVTISTIPSKHETYAEAVKALKRFHNTATTTYEIREINNGN